MITKIEIYADKNGFEQVTARAGKPHKGETPIFLKAPLYLLPRTDKLGIHEDTIAELLRYAETTGNARAKRNALAFREFHPWGGIEKDCI